MNASVKNFDIAIVTGFGDKGIDALENEFIEELQPHSSTIIASAPWHRALQHPETIIQRVSEDVDALKSDRLLLVGHSYGALIALVVACRKKMKNILGMILIDGPLNNERVVPTRLAHRLFFRHYDYRPQLAQECEESIARLKDLHILNVMTRQDRVVPTKAKRLSFANGSGGINLLLREEHKGHSMNEEKAAEIAEMAKSLMDSIGKAA